MKPMALIDSEMGMKHMFDREVTFSVLEKPRNVCRVFSITVVMLDPTSSHLSGLRIQMFVHVG